MLARSLHGLCSNAASRTKLVLSLCTVGLLVAVMIGGSSSHQTIGAEPKQTEKSTEATKQDASSPLNSETRQDASSTLNAKDFDQKIAPFMKKYCADCHSGDKPEAALDVEKFKNVNDVVKSRKAWRIISQKLKTQEMPPDDHSTRPSAEEFAATSDWIDKTLYASLASQPIDPGRVTIRRLNRAEYNNTIRDLVGLDFKPAEDFPSDDVGYGFDNIGDVLAVPPILLEKYLSAADKIMERAITVDDPTKAYTQRIDGNKLTPDGKMGNAISDTGAYLLWANGGLTGDFNFPRDGEYQVRVEAWGDQAGPDPCKMQVKIDGQEPRVIEVPNDRFTPRTYHFEQQLKAGNRRITVSYINDYWDPKAIDAKKGGDRNLAISWVEIRGPIGLDPATLPESHKRVMIAEPPPTQFSELVKQKKKPFVLHRNNDAEKQAEKLAAERREQRVEAAQKILANFATRAFRRPVRKDELAKLMKLWTKVVNDQQPFERGIQVACTAVLISPHFIYRMELDPKPNDPNFEYTLSDLELATRLSYFLWSSMPDDELYQLAASNQLRRDGNLEKQVKRMMRDPKANALQENFASQWLQTRRLESLNFDQKVYRNFDESLRDAMAKETELFFTTMLVEDRSILDFLDADFTFLNEKLAKHYNIQGIFGEQFRRVDLSGKFDAVARRGGLLTMAGILAINSNPARTSPVKRGKWIMETILGTPPPPAPPMVPTLEDDKSDHQELVGTLKQRLEQHRADPNCASCHKMMDSLGFGLENFDALGAWRERDGGDVIDSAGVLPGGKKFSNPIEMKQVLKDKHDLFCRCLTEKMLTYALGRGLEEYDECTVEKISRTVAANEYRFSTLITEIVKSDPFQKKRGAGVRK